MSKLNSSTSHSIQVVSTDLDELRQLLNTAAGDLFVILDACDEPRVPNKVKELGDDRAVSLYRGSAEQDYWAIAPYLAQVDDSLLNWIVENLWDDPWGVFVSAQSDLVGLRKHFRRFLRAELPGNQPVFFRFYDPRVLMDYLSQANPAEAGNFFGAVSKFYISAGSGKLQSIQKKQ